MSGRLREAVVPAYLFLCLLLGGSSQGAWSNLVLQLLERETLGKEEIAEIFAPIVKRPPRPAWTGSSRRTPSTRPPVLSPKELALTNGANGAAPAITTKAPAEATPEKGPDHPRWVAAAGCRQMGAAPVGRRVLLEAEPASCAGPESADHEPQLSRRSHADAGGRGGGAV